MKQSFYIPRLVAETLRRALGFSPVVVLTGPRQVGKSTLLRNEPPVKDWPYFTLDDPEVRSLAERAPEALLSYGERLVIDEVQKVPALLSHIKRLVDEGRLERVVLSGSSHLLLLSRVSESLAGRAVYLELTGFLLDEIYGPPAGLLALARGGSLPEKGAPVEDLRFLLFRGFLPPVVRLTAPEDIVLWWKGYVATYLERDLREISQINRLGEFHAFMEVLAARSAALLNQNEAARDASLSPATAGRYLQLLEASGLAIRLRPYFKNIPKRVLKRPKFYYLDPGLACALAGYTHPEEIPREFLGALFETLVLVNLWSLKDLVPGAALFFLHTTGAKEWEVDFLLKCGTGFQALEVKLTERPGLKEAEGLLKLKEIFPELKKAWLVHAGQETLLLPGGIEAVPWWRL